MEKSAVGEMGASGLREVAGRPVPRWSTLAISVAVAIVLSVTATLLLGRGWRPAGAGSGVCALGGDERGCCAPPVAIHGSR